MVINDFDVIRMAFLPVEAYPPLIVNPDAPLAFSLADKLFQAVSWRYTKKFQSCRSVDKREVDFLVTIDGRPWFAVEVKLNDTVLSPNLLYFRDRLSIPYIYQVIKKDKVDLLEKGGRIVSAGRFLAGLI